MGVPPQSDRLAVLYVIEEVILPLSVSLILCSTFPTYFSISATLTAAMGTQRLGGKPKRGAVMSIMIRKRSRGAG